MKITRSSGNVFTDIGFDRTAAETLAVKADLVTLPARAIRLRGLTQSEAARLCGIEQGTLSKILNGKLTSVSIDRLAIWLVALGWNVRIDVAPRVRSRAKRVRGQISVTSAG